MLNVAGPAAPMLNVAGPAAPMLNVAGPAAPCPLPSPATLHRRTARRLRPVDRRPAGHETPPPRAAAVFADATLRRVLEVIDRRRPITQLRPLLAPALIDTVVSLTRAPTRRDGAAVLRRVRLRTAAFDDAEPSAAEVFATYTRGRRVRAIAARIELLPASGRLPQGGADRWQLVALQIG